CSNSIASRRAGRGYDREINDGMRMAATSWQRLTEAFPPPRAPLPAVDWPAVERSLGRQLPADYKRFVQTYGYARFADFLSVFLPASPYDYVELRTQWQIAADKIEFWLEWDEVGTPELPVDPHLLLPVAGTDNGNTVYWVARPPDDPDAWTLAVDEARSDGWHLFGAGIVDFLVATFIDHEPISVFPTLTGQTLAGEALTGQALTEEGP
ncbi:SMI1/KNR4 family protein, partial [Winogradskya humida]